MKKSKSMDKMPARKMPKGFEMPTAKKSVEKTAVTVKPKSSAKPTSGKIKITNVKVSTSGGPKPKATVSGKAMTASAKVTKPTTKVPTKKPAPLTGPAAVKEYQRQVSPAGVKKAEADAKKALDKKYPGLYKKSK